MLTTDDPKPADPRLIVWTAVKPNGCPEMGTAKSVEAVPDRATLVCRVGDDSWVRLPYPETGSVNR